MSFANDTFTEASDTAIASHTPDSGGTWTQHPNSANGATVIAAEDRVRGDSDTATTIFYHSSTPPSADQIVEGTMRRTGASGSPLPRVVGRMNTTASTYIQLYMSHGDSTFVISEISGGSVSETNSVAQTWAVDTDYATKLEIIGTGLNGAKGYLGGIQKVQITPDVVTAVGKVGVGSRLYGRVDDWVATDAAGGGILYERTVTDGIYMPDVPVQQQNKLLSEALFLVDVISAQSIRQLLSSDQCLLNDSERMQLEKLFTDNVLTPDYFRLLLEKVVMDKLFLWDSGSMIRLKEILASDSLMLADEQRKTLEKVIQDRLLTPDYLSKYLQAILSDNMFLGDSVAAQKLGGVIERLLTDYVLLYDDSRKAIEALFADKLILFDIAQKILQKTVVDFLLTGDATAMQKVRDVLGQDYLLLSDQRTSLRESRIQDNLLMGSSVTKIYEMLLRDGFLTSDSVSTAITEAVVEYLLYARMEIKDYLGIQWGASDYLGIQTGYGPRPELFS